jgi:protein SCO1/2
VNLKALYALLIALVLPVVCYFIIKKYSDELITVPGHFIADSVSTRTIRGKKTSDTIWHKVPDFELTNQLGEKVSLKDLEGKIIVADFFFTHCPTICPKMTQNMKRLQQSIMNSQTVGDRRPDFIQFLSFSIDPERDSVTELKKWADRFQVDPDNWWLLTGDKKTIYNLALNDMKIFVEDGQEVDSNFIHTDHFVLIDRNRTIRGRPGQAYHGLDTTSLAQLSQDIIFLTLEKDRTKKGFLAGKLELIAIVLLLTLIGVGLLLLMFRKKKSQ